MMVFDPSNRVHDRKKTGVAKGDACKNSQFKVSSTQHPLRDTPQPPPLRVLFKPSAICHLLFAICHLPLGHDPLGRCGIMFGRPLESVFSARGSIDGAQPSRYTATAAFVADCIRYSGIARSILSFCVCQP